MKQIPGILSSLRIIGANHNTKMRWIALICMVVFAAQCCSGTAVIVLRVGGKVWIASDSMQSDQTRTIFRSDCKILEEGEFYWAAAGPVYIDIRRGFQVKNLVDRIKSEKGTLRSRMKAFIANSKQPIAKELASIRKDDRTFFAKLLTYNSLLQIVFVGFEEEHPAFVWASLTAREVNGRVVVDGTVEEPPRDQSSGLLGIGETIQAQEYIRKNGSRLATDPIGVIRESIIVQELAEPQMVGGNVSILQISRDGKQWIDKGVCK